VKQSGKEKGEGKSISITTKGEKKKERYDEMAASLQGGGEKRENFTN